MGSPETALKLLTSELKEDAYQLSEEVYNMNETRKSLTESNFNIVNEYIKSNSCLSFPVIIVKSTKIEKGLTGLIASKVLNEYGKTAVIMYEEDGICVGSIRSRDDDNARDMLEFAKVYLTKFGGHKNAAGFSLETYNFDKFSTKIINYASNQNFKTEKKEDDIFDMELNFNDINIKLASILELFKPFGVGNEEPLFMSKKVYIDEIKKIHKNNKMHLILELRQNNKNITSIIWNINEEDFFKLENSNYIDIIYKLKVNRFANNSDTRLYIEKYKIY